MSVTSSSRVSNAPELSRLAENLAEQPRQGWAVAKLGDSEFRRIGAFVESHCGIRCPPGKRVMLEARLRRRLRALGLESFGEYCDRVLGPKGDALEIEAMINEVTTNKTEFFREAQHFDYLMAEAVPALVADRDPVDRRPLSFWSAACSTGEEVYTLAMVLEEGAEQRRGRPYTVLGTDISTQVITRAARGIYAEAGVAAVPPELRRRHLLQSRDRASGLVRIVPSLRSKVQFGCANLLIDAELPRTMFDVIFCRNVFIYFDRSTQLAVLHRLAARLSPGGYLFLGHADSITGLQTGLTPVAQAVYRQDAGRGGR